MANPTTQTVMPTGRAIAPESLAPVPADWATVTYHLTIVPHPDDATIPMCVWAISEAGGEPVTGTGWGYNWGNNWGGGS